MMCREGCSDSLWDDDLMLGHDDLLSQEEIDAKNEADRHKDPGSRGEAGQAEG